MRNRLISDGAASRRTFPTMTFMALIAGVAISIVACGGDNATSLTVGGPGATDQTGSISSNHGHVATLTVAQLTAGDAVTMDIRGNADHSHIVGFTGAEVAQIRNSQRVTATSSTETSPTSGPHSHTVTFN